MLLPLYLSRKTKIVNQNWLVTVFFFALLLVLLYGAFLILSPFLKAITWAAILALLFYPAYAWLLRLLHGRATMAALIIIVLIALVVVLPGLRIAGFLSEEAIDSLVYRLRERLRQSGSAWGMITTVRGQGVRLEM